MGERDRLITKLDSSYVQQYNAYQQREQERRKRLMRRLIVFAVVVFIIIGSMATYHIKQRALHAKMKEEFTELEQQLKMLQADESELQEEISLLNNDQYILEIARSNYFFSKEGELIFNIDVKDATN